MKKKILQQAFEELNDAIAYYEEQQAGLGLNSKECRKCQLLLEQNEGCPFVPSFFIINGGYL